MKINFIVKIDPSTYDIMDPYFVLTLDNSVNLNWYFEKYSFVKFVKSKKEWEEIARYWNNIACINYYENKKQEIENKIQDYENKIENMQDYLSENY